ncbi:MAG: TonB C-terminal domain-containing protein [Bdellovibrionota bacterium]
MAKGLRETQNQFFGKAIRMSIAIHAILAIVAVFTGVLFPRDAAKFTPSIRVDIVDIPDFAKRDLNKYTLDDMNSLDKRLTEASKGAKKLLKDARSSKPEQEPDASDAMVLKKVKPSGSNDLLKSAIDRIKAIAQIESEVKKADHKKKVIPKGNVKSEGDSLTGENTGETNVFLTRLQGRLRDNWNLPVWLSQQNLDAKVVIFLDRQGYVKHTVFAKNSGNKQFDDYVLKTIRMSQPFGTPPGEVMDGGVTLGFPL